MSLGEKVVRGSVACVLVVLTFGAVAHSASASGTVARGTSILDGSSTISFNAGAGEVNNLSIVRAASDRVRVTDVTSAIDPIGPCFAVTPNVVDCPVDPGESWLLTVYLMDESDSVALNPPPPGLSDAGEGSTDFNFFSGGTGADLIEGTPGRDRIDGEQGSDVISGLSGSDILIGGPDDDQISATDSRVDAQIDCGTGADSLFRDNVDPVGDSCETVETTAADMSRSFDQRMPNVKSGIFRPMAAQEVVDTLALLFPARLDANPLTYRQAKALAGREPQPFEVLEQSPNPGVGVRVSLGSPQKVRLSYWDPSDDAVRQKCDPRARVRSSTSRSKGLPLNAALIGLEFREGVKGSEGEAQELLRRFGCVFQTNLVYSRSLESSSRVIEASFKPVRTRIRVNGRIRIRKSWKLVVTAKVAKGGNDFLLLFSDNPDAPAGQLPLSSQSRAAKRENSSFRLFLREAATGRAAPGVTVELKDGDPKSSVIAAGRTNSEGEVNLQFRASGPGDLKLYAFKQLRDPASGELVTQDSTVEITSTTAGKTWTSLGGRNYVERAGGGYRRTSGVGPSSVALASASATNAFTYVFQISQAMTALSLAQVQGPALGLSVSQTSELALIYAAMLGVDPGNEAASSLLGATSLEPTLGVGSAGKICESNGVPQMVGKLMPGFSGTELKVGGAVLAKLDCGRSFLTSPSGLAVLPHGWVSGSKPLIANDGASLIANDGASLIANDGASLIANDGASLLANDGASLIANDGASLLPVSQLMSDHGAGIVSNHSSGLIANDGASFNPLGGRTSLMPATGR
jgi:hypothetical protein